MPDSGLRVNWQGVSLLEAQLRLLTLTPQRRKRAMSQMGREVVKQTRKNVRNQKSVKGRSFADRNKKRSKKGKMLSGFVKGRNIRQKATADKVTIGFKNDGMARMANAHQTGQKQTVKAKKMSQQTKAEWKNSPATRSQAREMNRLGFKVEKKGGKTRKVSQAWIVNNLTKLQALGVLYKLNNDKKGKQSWQVTLPAREFFPNDAAWVRAMAVRVVQTEYKRER